MIEIVVDKLSYGWSPEEIHFQHPNLMLAQIHGALTHYYYYENQVEIDAQIQRRLEGADRLASSVFDHEFRRRLKSFKPGA